MKIWRIHSVGKMMLQKTQSLKMNYSSSNSSIQSFLLNLVHTYSNIVKLFKLSVLYVLIIDKVMNKYSTLVSYELLYLQ